ncbi:hypothetical protein BV22DRAFT_1100824 [Leucogyrophana mollusca]|uniref:Uncharacterized protein n=1 Tax=Leucogyrophana mollusca TaxID=85980 RepID=A0ACB8AX02_9AGAM|nr:hypothetical protein BV22DRAFT_1100824 [Leucogyrophana mollusca]
MDTQVRVGVGVFVLNERGQFVLGKRKGSHGAGTWALPGGHLELQESFESCAEREVREETGLEVTDLGFLTATNDIMVSENKHYVTVFVGCRVKGEKTVPEVREPNKCERWEWVTWSELQAWGKTQTTENVEGRRIFLPLLNLLAQRPTFDLQTS